MSANPVEAEATGQEFIAVTFSGTTFRVPLDVDSWPLDLVRNSRGFNKQSEQIVVNYSGLVTALQELLGDQFPDFLEAAPKRKQLTEASNVFAAAVGIPGSLDSDIVFGAVPRLLALIDTWPGKVESDLNRFWNLDYLDRWRFLAGRRILTLRRIHERLSNLPADSSLVIAMGRRTPQELLLMDVFEAITQRRHPGRPMSREELAQREAAAKQSEKDRTAHEKRMQKRRDLQHIENARANARRNLGDVNAQT